MTLLTILGSIVVGVLFLIVIMYSTTWIMKRLEEKWMRSSAKEILIVSGIMIAMFSILLLTAIIRVGLMIWTGEIK